MKELLFIYFFINFIWATQSHQSGWYYDRQDLWPEQCRSGFLQSPINLKKTVSEEFNFEPFVFENYNQIYPAIIRNNGHSIHIRLQVEPQPRIRGGGLPGEYILDHIHFHWKSEHTIDNYRFPVEIHMVHYSSRFSTFDEAISKENGIAVFAILYEFSPDDDELLAPLIHKIEKLQDHTDVPQQLNFLPIDYLPRDRAGYYRYKGSLTTPPCTEGIIWTIFTNTLPISESQVKKFPSFKSFKTTQEDKPLKYNFRSLQEINGREVFLKISSYRATASIFYGYILTIVFFTVITVFCF